MFRNSSSSVWALIVVAIALGGARAAEPIPTRVWDDLASENPATVARAVSTLEAAGPQAVAFLRERLKPVAADGRRIDALIEQLDSPRFCERRLATEELEYLGKLAQPQLEKALAEAPPLEVRRRVELLLSRFQPRAVSLTKQQVLGEALGEVDFNNGEQPDLGVRINEQPDLGVRNKPYINTDMAVKKPDGGIMLSRLQQRAARQLLEAPPVSPTVLRAGQAIRVLERVNNTDARELLTTVAGGVETALPTVEARSALERLKGKATR